MLDEISNLAPEEIMDRTRLIENEIKVNFSFVHRLLTATESFLKISFI